MSEQIRRPTLVRALLLLVRFLGLAAAGQSQTYTLAGPFAIPTTPSNPFGIAPGPASDGNVWFTETYAPNGYKVARITPPGQVTEYALPPVRRRPLPRSADTSLLSRPALPF